MINSMFRQELNALLGGLSDLLDPHQGPREVMRAYTLAQNSLCTTDATPAAFSDLAAKLRTAAEMAERVAEISR